MAFKANQGKRLDSFYPLDSYKDVKSHLIFSKSLNSGAISISIAIPTYNRLSMLKKCIKSVSAQNTSINYELVVVDNSQNITNEYLDDVKTFLSTQPIPNIRYYLNEKNIGSYGNWNRAMFFSRGVWVALVADDDYLHPYFLKSFEPFLSIATLKGVGFIGSRLLFLQGSVLEISQAIKSFCEEKTKKLLTGYNVLRPDSYYKINIPDILGSLINKEMLLSVGGFPETGSVIEDWFFNAKFVYKCGGIMIENVVYAACNYSFSDSSRDEIWTSAKIDAFYFRKELKERLNLRGFCYSSVYQKLSLMSEMVSFQFSGKRRKLDTKKICADTGIKPALYCFLFPLFFIRIKFKTFILHYKHRKRWFLHNKKR